MKRHYKALKGLMREAFERPLRGLERHYKALKGLIREAFERP